MIESAKMVETYDRLTAFLRAYDLSADAAGMHHADDAHLVIMTCPETGEAVRIDLVSRGDPAPLGSGAVAARIAFGGAANPLLAALPARLTIALESEPALRGMADLFVAEARHRRCGGATVRSRLGEVILVMAIRRAIDRGAVGASLLAGLAHPRLHRSLVALHDDPGRAWRIDDLCAIAQMSRGHFIARFPYGGGRDTGRLSHRLADPRSSGSSVRAKREDGRASDRVRQRRRLLASVLPTLRPSARIPAGRVTP